MMQQMEVTRQRRQQKLELFRTIKQMRGAGMKVNQIARQLGLCRRRIDKWIQLDELPERSNGVEGTNRAARPWPRDSRTYRASHDPGRKRLPARPSTHPVRGRRGNAQRLSR
jgi:Homeodomain-like domain